MIKAGILPADFFESRHPLVNRLLDDVRGMVADPDMIERIEKMHCGEVQQIMQDMSNHPAIQPAQTLVNIGIQNVNFLKDWRKRRCPGVLFPKAFSKIIGDVNPGNFEDTVSLHYIIQDGLLRDPARFNSHVVSRLCQRDFPVEWRFDMFHIFLSRHKKGFTKFIDQAVLSAYFASHKEVPGSAVSFVEVNEILDWAKAEYDKGDNEMLSESVFTSYMAHPGVSLVEMESAFSYAQKKGLLTLGIYNTWNAQILHRHPLSRSQYPLSFYKEPDLLSGEESERAREIAFDLERKHRDFLQTAKGYM